MTEPTIIPGGVAVDDRGSVRFVNDFDFKNVKRFYQVENHRVGFIRAWHGHLKESKYVYVVRGSIQLKLCKIYELTEEEVNQGYAWRNKHLHRFKHTYYHGQDSSYFCCDQDKTVLKGSIDENFVLSSQAPKILYIPAGYANGFKTLEEDTSVLFFSTIPMDEAADDDYRFSTNEKEWKEDFR